MPLTCYTFVQSPVGRLLLAGDETGLRRIGFARTPAAARPEAGWRRAAAPFSEARRQLAAYFAGRRREFALPLVLAGTPFERRVWAAVRAVPYGETASYAEVARRIGRPRAGRAVGAANARNPLPIVVPCHRLVASDGRLAGYAGGLAAKQALLALEGARPRPRARARR